MYIYIYLYIYIYIHIYTHIYIYIYIYIHKNPKVKEKIKKATTHIISCITSYYFLVISAYLLVMIISNFTCI